MDVGNSKIYGLGAPLGPDSHSGTNVKPTEQGGWGAHFIHVESTILVPLPGSAGHIFHHVPEAAASILDI